MKTLYAHRNILSIGNQPKITPSQQPIRPVLHEPELKSHAQMPLQTQCLMFSSKICITKSLTKVPLSLLR